MRPYNGLSSTRNLMPIDWSKAKYLEADEFWHLSLTEEEVRTLWGESLPQQKASHLLSQIKISKPMFRYPLHIEIAGTSENYETRYEPIVEEAVRQFRVLIQQAEKYLKSFIDLSKAHNSSGELCHYHRMSFGTWKKDPDDDTEGDVEIYFELDKDRYGWWVVRFSYSEKENDFIPFYFSREQT